MLTSPENYILAEIKRKFKDEQGGLVIDTTWHPEEYTTVEGVAVSVPVRFQSDMARKILGEVKKGDKIFFSYSVIFDYEKQESNDTPVYRNLITFEGKEYWKVHAGEVFCTMGKEGIMMITDNVLLEPQTESTGIIKSLPNINLSCNMGDVVCFEPKFVQKYNILGAEHYIIPSRRVIAKV